MKSIIIIPAYNEQDNILELIKKVKLLDHDYIIINDCSTDNTDELLNTYKLNHLNLPNNVGISVVTQIGFKYAVEFGYDSAIVIDGDGQHPPKYINQLLNELENGYDYVIGSRYVNERKPWNPRMIGSRLISLCLFLVSGKKINDPTSGMRAMGMAVLSEFANYMNYVAEPDALAYLLKKGYRIYEVQITMEERKNGESYFINPIHSIKFMVSVIISILFIQIFRGKYEH